MPSLLCRSMRYSLMSIVEWASQSFQASLLTSSKSFLPSSFGKGGRAMPSASCPSLMH